MPPKYKQWKNTATLDLQDDFDKLDVALPLPFPVAIDLVLKGKHSRKSDLDNTIGAVLDALQDAGIIKNDNPVWVPRISAQMLYDTKAKPTWELTLSCLR